VLLRRNSTDRNYTGGFGFGVAGPEARGALTTGLLRVADWATLVRRLHASDSAKAQYAFAVFGSAFTPETIRVSNIQRGDRPYGSIFALSATETTHDDKQERFAWTSQLVVGALGLDISKNTQSELHRFLRRRCQCGTPYAPQGWANQIANGGEVTGLYRLQHQRLVGTADILGTKDPIRAELIWDAEGSVGYYTNGAIGGRARFGLFHAKFWEFDAAPMSSFSQKSIGGGALPIDLFGFIDARARGIAYNALLEGERRQSVYTIASDSIRRGILEHDVGLSLVFPVWCSVPRETRRSIAVTWVIESGRSAEFVSAAQRAHRWGALHFTYFPAFLSERM
jgi:hypothetical protein